LQGNKILSPYSIISFQIKFLTISLLLFLFIAGCDKSNESDSFAEDSPESKGLDLFHRMACNACHSVDGSLKLGPTIKNQYGKEIRHTNGTVMIINDDYILESLIDPLKHIVDGYTPIMPSYKPVLSDEDVENIIAYIKALR